jgi:drug/metabolite transporter (DMT)-like permease
VPIVVVWGWRGELMAAVRTERPLGQVLYGLISIAGMFLTFAALARLQLVDVMAIGFASPLITIVLAALILKERVPAYRWFAVAIGFCGVTIMIWPYFFFNTGSNSPLTRIIACLIVLVFLSNVSCCLRGFSRCRS